MSPKMSRVRGGSSEPVCIYNDKRVILVITNGKLQLVEKKFLSRQIVLEVELSKIEKVEFSNGTLTYILEDGTTLSLNNCSRVEGIVEYSRKIVEEKITSRRIREREKKLFGKALEVFSSIKELVVDVYPAIVEVARLLKDIPDYEEAIGKANHLASLVEEATEIVRALRVYDSIRAHKLLIELSRKLYDDAVSKVKDMGLGRDIEEYLLKTLDLGILLNTIIAKIYAGMDYSSDMEKAKVLVKELIGSEPGFPKTPRPEHLYDKLSTIIDRIEGKFKEIAASKAHEEALREVKGS